MIPHKEASPFPVVHCLNFEELKIKKKESTLCYRNFLPIVARLDTSSKVTIRHNEVIVRAWKIAVKEKKGKSRASTRDNTLNIRLLHHSLTLKFGDINNIFSLVFSFRCRNPALSSGNVKDSLTHQLP